jgi:hypothetical protein
MANKRRWSVRRTNMRERQAQRVTDELSKYKPGRAIEKGSDLWAAVVRLETMCRPTRSDHQPYTLHDPERLIWFTLLRVSRSKDGEIALNSGNKVFRRVLQITTKCKSKRGRCRALVKAMQDFLFVRYGVQPQEK